MQFLRFSSFFLKELALVNWSISTLSTSRQHQNGKLLSVGNHWFHGIF